MTRAKLLAVCSIVILICSYLTSCYLIGYRQGTDAFSGDQYGAPWPPFTMIYKTPSGSLRRMTYVNARVFCTHSITAHGSVYREGELVSAMSCKERDVLARTQAVDEPFELPDLWIRPSRFPYWLDEQERTSGVEIATAIRETHDWVPYQGGRYEIHREEITYRTIDGIPLRWLLMVDNRVVAGAEVVELEVYR